MVLLKCSIRMIHVDDCIVPVQKIALHVYIVTTVDSDNSLVRAAQRGSVQLPARHNYNCIT